MASVFPIFGIISSAGFSAGSKFSAAFGVVDAVFGWATFGVVLAKGMKLLVLELLVLEVDELVRNLGIDRSLGLSDPLDVLSASRPRMIKKSRLTGFGSLSISSLSHSGSSV